MERFYLEINPEFFASGVKFENGDYLDDNQKILDKQLFYKVKEYNNKCLRFIRMSPSTQSLYWKEMYELDLEGWELKIEIEKEPIFKVKFFSPFLLKYLFEKPRETGYSKELTKKGNFKKKFNELIHKFFGDSSYGKNS